MTPLQLFKDQGSIAMHNPPRPIVHLGGGGMEVLGTKS